MRSAFYIHSTSQMVLNTKRCELGWLSQCLRLRNCNTQIQIIVGLLGLLGMVLWKDKIQTLMVSNKYHRSLTSYSAKEIR